MFGISWPTRWKISRPRFWMYTFGPYIVGLLIGARDITDLAQPFLWLFALYFTFPANLLIYGVNDIFDYATDVRNAKKQDYEILVRPAQHKALWQAIAVCNAPIFLLAIATVNPMVPMALLSFWFFSVFYSAPPIRAKAWPVLDSMFNILYAYPAFFAYFLIGGQNFALPLVVGAWCWTMAMHAYSAVPDISADREAGIPTIATLLGFRNTLLFCLLLYLASAWFAFPEIGLVAVLLGAIYTALMLISMAARNEAGVMRIYKWFPLINTLCGMTLFFAILLRKFY